MRAKRELRQLTCKGKIENEDIHKNYLISKMCSMTVANATKHLSDPFFLL